MAHIRLASSYSQMKPIENPIKKYDLISMMTNKQGYTNGTSTGSFTDNQITYEMQADGSTGGYYEYTVYGKLDISQIKGKAFNIVVDFEDIVLPSDANRFWVRLYYSADGNFILPTTPSGGIASGINWAFGTNNQFTPQVNGNSIQIKNLTGFSGVSADVVDFYVCIFFAPNFAQSRPSGKIKITLTTKNIIETLSFVKGGQQTTNFNITPTDYTSQGGNVIQPTITQGDGYVEIETTHINTNTPWWDIVIYQTLTNEQIQAIKQSNHCLINAEFISPDGYTGTIFRGLRIYNGATTYVDKIFDDISTETGVINISRDDTFNFSSATFNRLVLGQQKQGTPYIAGTYKIRIRDLYFYWKG